MLKRDDVKLLWHDGFYDGPLSGALEWEGKRYYFRVAEESLYTDENRTFDIIDLPEETWIEYDKRHEDFRKYVGTHCDYDGEGRRDLRGVNPDHSEWAKFYDKYQEDELVPGLGPVVGQWNYR